MPNINTGTRPIVSGVLDTLLGISVLAINNINLSTILLDTTTISPATISTLPLSTSVLSTTLPSTTTLIPPIYKLSNPNELEYSMNTYASNTAFGISLIINGFTEVFRGKYGQFRMLSNVVSGVCAGATAINMFLADKIMANDSIVPLTMGVKHLKDTLINYKPFENIDYDEFVDVHNNVESPEIDDLVSINAVDYGSTAVLRI